MIIMIVMIIIPILTHNKINNSRGRLQAPLQGYAVVITVVAAVSVAIASASISVSVSIVTRVMLLLLLFLVV